jgi:replicative DNA helicase Mcm
MEIAEVIERFQRVLELECADKLGQKAITGENRIVVDYMAVARLDFDLAEELLRKPEETSQVAAMAAQRINIDLPIPFVVRFKNWPQSLLVEDMGSLRAKNEGDLITLRGIIQTKSQLTPDIWMASYACKKCGKLLKIPQTREDKVLSKPDKCPCGAKSGFTLEKKEYKDFFTIMIEEPADEMEGGQALSRIRCVCEGDMSSRDVERALSQGGRVDVTGIVIIRPEFRNGVQLTTNEIEIKAIYIKVYDEHFLNIKWDVKDEEEFQKLARSENTLEKLKQNIFYDIVGHEEIKEGLILQMFGGVSSDPNDKSEKRGQIHALLIGDPGQSKSDFLKIIKNTHPKAGITAGTHLTKAGLVGAVTRDERDGKWQLEAGPLILLNNGCLCIDEFDKTDKANQTSLNMALQDGKITIAKANIHATLMAKTSLLCAANPKHGSWSDYDSILNQMQMDPTLLQRFDLMYFLFDKDQDPGMYEKIARAVRTRNQPGHERTIELTRDFIRKYIAYARRLRPSIPEHVGEYLEQQFVLLKKAQVAKLKHGQADVIPFSPRVLGSFLRMAEAHARCKLNFEVTMADAEKAVQMVSSGFNRLGINTKEMGFETYEADGKVVEYRKVDMKARIDRLLRSMTEKDPMGEQDLIDILKKEGFDPKSVEDYINLLVAKGEAMRPRHGLIKVIM